MNHEPTPESAPTTPLDQEFAVLETELEGRDRLVMTRQIMEEIFRPDVKKTYRWFIENEKGEIVPNKNYPKEKFAGSLQTKMARAGGPLKHFLGNETQIDLVSDNIKDIKVKFSALSVNRIEMTLKSLLTKTGTVNGDATTPTQTKLCTYTFTPDLNAGMSEWRRCQKIPKCQWYQFG